MELKKFSSMFSLRNGKSMENLKNIKSMFNLSKNDNIRSSISSSIRNRPTIVKSNSQLCIEKYLQGNKNQKKEKETDAQLQKRKTKIKKEQQLIKDGKTIKQKGLILSKEQEDKFISFIKEYKEFTNTNFIDGNLMEYYIKFYNHCHIKIKLPVISPKTIDSIEKGELFKQYSKLFLKINSN